VVVVVVLSQVYPLWLSQRRQPGALAVALYAYVHIRNGARGNRCDCARPAEDGGAASVCTVALSSPSVLKPVVSRGAAMSTVTANNRLAAVRARCGALVLAERPIRLQRRGVVRG
jgi:hypothetical protein